MCPEGKEQLAEGWENPDTGLKCVVDPVFHSTLNCDCTSSESSFDFMQLVTAIGPFIHCILMPYFMKQKQEYGKKQLEASLDANRESAMMQDDGKMVVFAIKYTLGQKIFIFICGTIIKLVGFAISIAKMAGMDFSSFWFPLPFFNFVREPPDFSHSIHDSRITYRWRCSGRPSSRSRTTGLKAARSASMRAWPTPTSSSLRRAS